MKQVMLPILASCTEKEFWSDRDKKADGNMELKAQFFLCRNLLLATLTVGYRHYLAR